MTLMPHNPPPPGGSTNGGPAPSQAKSGKKARALGGAPPAASAASAAVAGGPISTMGYALAAGGPAQGLPHHMAAHAAVGASGTAINVPGPNNPISSAAASPREQERSMSVKLPAASAGSGGATFGNVPPLPVAPAPRGRGKRPGAQAATAPRANATGPGAPLISFRHDGNAPANNGVPGPAAAATGNPAHQPVVLPRGVAAAPPPPIAPHNAISAPAAAGGGHPHNPRQQYPAQQIFIQRPPPNAPPPQMRELRVEDALKYLDDVKREFGDRPRIYNEFLEIMKLFKTQEVDTPGVIARVSNLFRGYNNLILGFNKFLPDGYKIELQDLVDHDAALEQQRQRQQQQQQQQQQKPSSLQQQPQQQQQQQAATEDEHGGPIFLKGRGAPPGQVQHIRGQPAAATPAAPAISQQTLQLQQHPKKDAPPSQPGLMASVQPGEGPPSARGPGTVTVPNFRQGAAGAPQPVVSIATPSAPPSRLAATSQQAPPPPSHGLMPSAKSTGAHGQQQPPPAGAHAQQHPSSRMQMQQQHAPPPPPPPPHGGSVAQRPNSRVKVHPSQAVEFDHAITYVTTIKKRFASDPRTYQTFLEILHTYQKEQRGIKEVLEQVALLFADHPDLLKEFTFFLPDAVQEQAKERLHRAAADSEARQAAQRMQAQKQREAAESYEGAAWKGQQQHRPPQEGVGSMIIDMTSPQEQAAPGDGPAQAQDASASIRQPKRVREKATPSRKRPFSPTSGGPAPAPLHITQPENYVYNAGVERQFFDAAKDALTSYSRDGGQAWAEFLKCLDMYAQETLSRTEMLGFVEPLFGKRYSDLFEEFKRILSAAGSPTAPTLSLEDSWYSVPLSEIDFSRCRRCSTSYRALPRDYPLPPCSERSEDEKKVLNDVWVSLPVGSEESYTFRHMRRNQYEEVLFRCEDERFEIDMVIDSNAATLTRLEPIVEEIEQLAKQESLTTKTAMNGESGGGMGGKVVQYTLDKRTMTVIHKHSIRRIYGDAGEEMLELMFKNPSTAIPVVVQRLRQKDREWKGVRARLNKRWKELAEMNYHKSLDHRSLTWRTTDKRATSTRTLVAEIKDRAANDGNESEAALQARREKAREEHGSFYDVTVGSLSQKIDLTDLPKPTTKLFTPHLSLMFKNNSWAQRDAYRILSFAVERGSISPGDKERCHRLWRDFLGPWFELSLNWMQSPALLFKESAIVDTTPSVVSNGEESGHDEDEESSGGEESAMHEKGMVTEELVKPTAEGHDIREASFLLEAAPLPPGAVVSTVYGDGKIVAFRHEDRMYEISMSSFRATAFIRPRDVLCTVLAIEPSSYTHQLRAEYPHKLERPDDKLAIGTQSLYLFFRLYQVLVRRLNIARELAYKVSTDQSISCLVEQMVDEVNVGRKRYEAYLSLVYGLVEGGYNNTPSNAAEGGKYEDRVRCLLGHGAYELATMDKLISHILKNLQSMGNDETMQSMVQLFRRHLDTGEVKPEALRQEASYLSEGENMYAFQYCRVPESDNGLLHVEFLGCIADGEDVQSEVGSVTTDHGDNMDIEVEPPATKRPRRGSQEQRRA